MVSFTSLNNLIPMDFQLKRIHIVAFVVGITLLSITAEKCREIVGDDNSSQSGKFTILECFDMSYGTLGCGVKEGVKIYTNNIRSAHVEAARQRGMEGALADALSQGIDSKAAAKLAQKAGAKSAKEAKREAKRIIGPIISSGYDFSEAIYYGGAVTEGIVRGTGTLFGTYAGGFLGDQRLGRFGYLVGSELGSWVGGRIGLMVYDVISTVSYLIRFGIPERSEAPPYGSSDDSSVNEATETPADTSSEDSYVSQLGTWVRGKIGLMLYDVTIGFANKLTFGIPESREVGEAPPYESSDDCSVTEATEAPADTSSEDSYVSQSGSWVQGKIGSMLYDVINKLTFGILESSEVGEAPPNESSEDSYISEPPAYTSSEDSNVYESSYESSNEEL